MIMPRNKAQARRLLAAAETGSEHPLAAAVREFAGEISGVTAFEAAAGHGTRCEFEGHTLLAGSRRWMEENGVALVGWAPQGEALAAAGKTPIWVARDGVPVALCGVADEVKPQSADAVKEMQAMHLRVVLLTGDDRRVAAAVAAALGIEQVEAEVLPADKERVIRTLQEKGHRVAMVGDGINDAAALTRADVGFAIGSGTDVAVESADVVLMKNDLRDVVFAIRLSRATLRTIKENLFWAFFYNTIGIPVAAGVFYPLFGWEISPMLAAAAMSLSSLFVVTNALRLRRMRLTASEPQPPASDSEKSVKIPEEGDEEMFGGPKIVLTVEGMSCGHCSARVEAALNAVPGAKAKVDLAKKTATVKGCDDKDALIRAVTEAGYNVTDVKEK